MRGLRIRLPATSGSARPAPARAEKQPPDRNFRSRHPSDRPLRGIRESPENARTSRHPAAARERRYTFESSGASLRYSWPSPGAASIVPPMNKPVRGSCVISSPFDKLSPNRSRNSHIQLLLRRECFFFVEGLENHERAFDSTACARSTIRMCGKFRVSSYGERPHVH
jgi:hypothetical protein